MSALIIRHGNPTRLPIDLLLSAIPSLPRAALDRLAQQAIDRMDELDGDCDLEDDDQDCEHDGTEPEDWRPDGILLPPPLYGADQSAGPINVREGEDIYLLRIMTCPADPAVS